MCNTLFESEDEVLHVHSYTETVYLNLDGAWVVLHRCPDRETGYDMGPQFFPCNTLEMPWHEGSLETVEAPPKGAEIISEESLKYQDFSADYLRNILKRSTAAKK